MSQTQPIASLTDRVGDYARAVVDGEIVAGPHVRNACRRHLDDLEKGHERGLWFDYTAAFDAIDFFESVLKLSEAHFEGEPFLLHESQGFIVGSLFGWKREDGNRRFRRSYCEQGKGNGKSPLAAGIGLKGLVADGEKGSQVYSTAAKREQADILFRDAVKMVKQSKKLKAKLDFSGGEGREYNIAHHPSGSFFRPTSRDTGKTGSGPRPYFVLADEMHELPDRRSVETLERGFKFRRQPLLFMITNSGSDRNSVAWEEHEHAVKVAAGSTEAVTDPTYVGEPLDDTTFSYVCALDEGEDPLEDPECWAKANPLLGVTITHDYLAGVVAQAKSLPGSMNNILRLHFCMWTDADTAWMARSTLEPCLADFDVKEHHGATVWMGLDLSERDDMTAIAAVVQTGLNEDSQPTFDAWIEAWVPGDTMRELALKNRLDHMPAWVRDGHLQSVPGVNINYRHIAQALIEYKHDFDVALVAYDQYAFKRFETEVDELGETFTFVAHPQGGTRKGTPLEPGADGLWMPSSVTALGDAIREKRIRLKRNPVLVSAIMSACPESDRWGNYWLSKQRSTNKIDAAIALAMAFGAASSQLKVEKPQAPFVMWA